jgi:hypothetical protein
VSVEYPIGEIAGVADVAQFAKDDASQLWCVNDEENLTRKEIEQKGSIAMYECSLEIKYSYTHSKKLLSHKLGEYGMYGGVHGIYNSETFTYDTEGKKVTLLDMAVKKDAYKKDLVIKLKSGFSNYQNKDSESNIYITNLGFSLPAI